MRRLRIDSEMSRKLGECGLSRNAVIRFRVTLRDDLEKRYQTFRQFRHPEDDRFFSYFLAVVAGDSTHRFWFVIDDSTSPDDLFIIDFTHERDSTI
jgi:hypothetical protein